MPLPKRQRGESRKDFVRRCMDDDVMRREFPETDQRLAVCQRQADMAAAGHVELLCQPGDITIEAAKGDGQEQSPPRFSMIAYTGDAMRIEGMQYPVVVDLEGLDIPSQRRPVRFGHSMYQGVGHTERIAVEGGRLIAEGVVSRDTAAAREVVASGKRGFPWQASLGAAVQKMEFVRAGKTVTVNGRMFEGPLYVARRTTLGEISFVDLGADTNTTATIAAEAGRNLEPGIRSEGKETSVMDDTKDTEVIEGAGETNATPPASDSEQQNIGDGNTGAVRDAQTGGAGPPLTQRVPRSGTDRYAIDERSSNRCVKGREAGASVTPSEKPTDTVAQLRAQAVEPRAQVAELRAQAVAETKRIAAIRKICAGRHLDIEERAIAEGWSTDKCELEVLRASRPKAPAVHVIDTSIDGHVLEAACLLTGKYSGVEREFDDRTLQAADRRFRGGITLQEFLLEAAWANGYTGRNFRNSREVLRHAFSGDIRAAYSTIDIGGILSNVANKFLLEGFFSVERTWRNITAVRNVSAFKTVTSYRLIGKDQ